MSRRTPSFNEGYSSSSSASPTKRPRTFEQHHAGGSRTRTRTRSRSVSDGQPSLLGSVGTLIRLALVALVLALIAPYVRTYLFGAAANKSDSVDTRVAKNTYHHQQPQSLDSNSVSKEGNAEVDVFNFSHQDYLAAAGREVGDKARKAVAIASPSAVLAPPSASSTRAKQQQKQQKQQQQQQRGKKASTRARSRSNDDELDDDDTRFNESPTIATTTTSSASSILTIIGTLLSTLYALASTAFRFASIPFIHLFRLVRTLFSTSYHAFRLSLSHTLRPVLHVLAPLTYLVSGMLFVFVQTPFRIVSAVVTELYPVYIFLGAAAVVGVAMGIASAGVMYLSAFVFVDRLPTQPVTAERSMVEDDHEDEQDAETPESPASPFTRAGYRHAGPPSAGYFPPHTQHSLYAPTPLASPATSYRPKTRNDVRTVYPTYPAAPGSSLRAAVL
ncbi:hypothetical protein EX895_005727 [Sporisorium graminicola]|uniref:Uncharacterized protein n=1 Tax=Sporisorium graminicola TaxID=280036 RepID=A0A4U7KMH6_9BASI|nr:hypothetical protein EX895_005727 [Sporisorium graminicola]TKY85565.1 hypothetical protein EX895_005727 [Sporisorium graminicola]